MQQAATPLCYPSLPFSKYPLVPPLPARLSPALLPPSPLQLLPFKPPRNYLPAILSPLHRTCTRRHSLPLATQETVETSKGESEFVEVGYISNVHGLQGEISVKPTTDFPELRFSKPGRRWLRQLVSGKDVIREVELVEGRGHHGRKSWILKFGGIDTVDRGRSASNIALSGTPSFGHEKSDTIQAKLLVGSTLLVREYERPELEEGEFYSRDLIGMRVILKETGECVGTVVNVFDSGGNDLLQVMLYTSSDVPDGTGKSKPAEAGVSGHLAWVPFVEAIVPDVNMNEREMRITPPKGLLELNLRLDERSKKERRELEWRERKKFQRRLIAAKKKLCEMEQKHVFDGLRYGDKSKRGLLADQIVGVNSKLLQQALENIEISSKRCSATELISATRTKHIKSSLMISKEFITCANEEKLGANFKLQEKGLSLISKGKVAIVLVLNDIETGKGDNPGVVDSESSENSLLFFLQKSLSDDQTFVKIEDRVSVPLILVCPAQEIQSLQKLFSNNEYFAFDSNKVSTLSQVWFLEEEKIPVVSSSEEEGKRHKIMMKSPWEILQSPVGSGGVISLLSSVNIPENLSKMGVEYIEICSSSQNCVTGSPLLLGFVESRKAEIGIKIVEDTTDLEESFDMIFSLNFMRLLAQQIHELQFYAIPKPNLHVEMVDKEWIDVVPSSPNSYELRSSIYSSLNACSLEKICVMEITE
ncbi:hypothetical protein POTOM_006319 [Populus tomentosa]|uniref:16S rRNA processing protein RimM family n=1 Tax=Populus tomentosa TaxID=118781 RepID=A0A8X8AKS4_POPTO|nr:hypothetical protein POTOM_006319 [Populus tomentosa]